VAQYTVRPAEIGTCAGTDPLPCCAKRDTLPQNGPSFYLIELSICILALFGASTSPLSHHELIRRASSWQPEDSFCWSRSQTRLIAILIDGLSITVRVLTPNHCRLPFRCPRRPKPTSTSTFFLVPTATQNFHFLDASPTARPPHVRDFTSCRDHSQTNFLRTWVANSLSQRHGSSSRLETFLSNGRTPIFLHLRNSPFLFAALLERESPSLRSLCCLETACSRAKTSPS